MLHATAQHNNVQFICEFTFVGIPAAVLQPPIYNSEWPSYATFGGIGLIIGHEIMHAYDYRSIAFKNQGVMTGWLDKTKDAVFWNRTDCLFHQFNAYTDQQTGIKVMDL